MFSFLSKFHQVDTSPSLSFTDLSVELFPNLDIIVFGELNNTPTFTSIPKEIVPAIDTVPDSSLHRSNQVRKTPVFLTINHAIIKNLYNYVNKVEPPMMV